MVPATTVKAISVALIDPLIDQRGLFRVQITRPTLLYGVASKPSAKARRVQQQRKRLRRDTRPIPRSNGVLSVIHESQRSRSTACWMQLRPPSTSIDVVLMRAFHVLDVIGSQGESRTSR